MSVSVTYLGHASFLLSADGQAVLIDPYEDSAVPGLGNIREEASAVYCSHEHGDHNFRGAAVLTGEECPFSVTEVSCFHDDKEGALRGSNIVRVFENGGIRIAHLGDLGHVLTAELKEALTDIDLMLIPVGGHFTIGPDEALAIIREVKPRAVIPMHYSTATSGYDIIRPLDDFIALAGASFYADGDTIIIDKDSPDGVLILEQKCML